MSAADRLEVALVPVLTDNYVFLAHEPKTGATAAVDPGVAGPVLAEAERRGWRISHILNTHWHPDHVGGNAEVKAATGATIIGPAREARRIEGLDAVVEEGDRVALGVLEARVIDVGGHTAGHIAYHFPDASALFCGDALFAMGCGKLFEGEPRQMYASLQKLAALPEATRVFCAHEYTAANGRFALHLEPENEEIALRLVEVNKLREMGQPTVPTTIALERRTNPFLRAGSVEEFARLRAEKDEFRG